MKKIISLTIIAILLLQVNLPIFSFANSLSTEDTNLTITISEKLKQVLTNMEIDKDNDGEFSASELESVETLYINCADSDIDLTGIEYMPNLTELSLQGRDNQSININYLPNVSSLETFELIDFDLSNLTGIQNYKSLKNLKLTSNNYQNLDTYSISQLTQLTSLEVANYLDDVSWMNNIKTLKQLKFIFFKQNLDVPQKFFDNINELEVQDIKIEGRITYNLGELETNKINEIHLDQIPLTKEMLDEKSKLYYKDFKYTLDGRGNYLYNSASEYDKMYAWVVPAENAKRSRIFYV